MNSPFNQEQAELLNRLLPTLTESQKAWLSGYLAAVQTADAAAALETLPAEAPAAKPGSACFKRSDHSLWIADRKCTGTCRKRRLRRLTERGFQVTVSSMSDFKPNQLKKVKNLLIVVSTHGEGDPPDNALSFHEFLHGRRAPKLDDLRFLFWRLATVRMNFSARPEKNSISGLEELGGTTALIRALTAILIMMSRQQHGLTVSSASLNEGQEQGGSAAPASDGSSASRVRVTVYSRKNPFQSGSAGKFKFKRPRIK